ncbi:MAG TPA: hypothetical protein VFD00_13675 [Thermoclostridium sp.]|nr:hypothetical protein [Thermoclostridium sp.]
MNPDGAEAISVEGESLAAKHDNKIVNEVIAQATEWLKGNYGEFYDLRNIHADVTRVFDNDSEIRYTVAITCETLLKYDCAEDLPFVQGLKSALAEKRP